MDYSNITDLILNADLVIKSVMAFLFIMSIISWTIIFYKFIYFSVLKVLIWKFLILFESKNSMNDIFVLAQGNSRNPLSRIIIASIKEWRSGKIRDKNVHNSDHKIDSIRNRIKTAIEVIENNILEKLESGTNILAIIGSNAPFVGLFGTVWGIMSSFQNIAESGNTSLAIVAPGIAEALFATAIGIFVALPAVISYNMLNKKIDNIANKIENFSILILNRITRKIEQDYN
jgi:biopolymer transport protein TolQ